MLSGKTVGLIGFGRIGTRTAKRCQAMEMNVLVYDPYVSADKIKAPLLLIHGTGDTNVVPTESEQMFTALRMLGREAELVRVQGENHGINSKPSVEEGRDAVMLDWFDKYLKK